jgi:crotonobetaine/carnitine-CoA ligase
MVPLNVRYRTADAAHVLTDSRARLTVTTPAYEHVVASSAVASVRTGELRPIGTWVQGPLDPLSTTNVQYTSGTTGRPKGCLLSHVYWTTLGGSMLSGFPRITGEDVMLTAQPFHYVDPMWNVVTALMAGAHTRLNCC